MTPDDRLDQDLRALRDCDVPDGPPAEIVSRTLAALHREGSGAPASPLLERIRTMPPLARFAAALLVAAGTTGLVSVVTSGRHGPGVAFADAVENVRAARTVTYTMRIGDDGKPFKVSRMEPGRIRTELPDGGITINDRLRGRSLVLVPSRKEAMLFEAKAGGPALPAGDEIDSLRRFRGRPDAELGEKVVDGRKARGFRFSEGGWRRVVWVDVKTDLPVRMESETAFNADGMKTIVLTDFVFDPPLDEALFSTTPPQGYSTRSVPTVVDAAPPTEKDLVELFGEYARRSGGRFPNDLQMQSLLDVLKDIKVAPDALDDATNAWIAKVAKGVGLIWAMPPTSEPRYTGKGVKLGQADKTIFRYRPQDSATFRVIYGDLSVKDVEPGQIAK